jgi:hypothetical protein
MDKVKKAQIQVRTLLKDYANMFSNIETREDLVQTFRKLFPGSKEYWKHLKKHAIPKNVIEELEINSWKKARSLSLKLMPYQMNYALQFLDTLSYPDKIALIESPFNPINKLVFFSSKKRMALVMEPSGKVVSVYELDKFKSWEDWKSAEVQAGSVVTEVERDPETQRAVERIRERYKRIIRRLR